MRRKRTRRHLLASEIATGGDTATEAAELFADTEQSPDSVKCAIEYARQWHRDNLLIQTGTILCTAFANHGLQIKPARGTEMDPVRFRAWWSAHRPAIRRFAREMWEDWFTLDNSVAFWRTRSPRVFVLPPEDCTYSDVFGIESLKVRLPWKDPSPTAMAKRYQAREVEMEFSQGEQFSVLKRGRVGYGFAWPRMTSLFDDLLMMRSLQVSDKLWAYVCRCVIRHFKIGHEIRNGMHAGSGKWFWTKKRGTAARKFFEGRLGILDYTSNFDVSLEFPFPSPERWDARRYEGVLQRIALWFGPVGQMLPFARPSEFTLKTLRAWAEDQREDVSAHLTRVVNGCFRPPGPVEVRWSNKIFTDTRQISEMLRLLLQSGPLSQATALEEAGYDPEEERARKEDEFALPKSKTLPIFDAAHGKRPAEPVGRPNQKDGQ